MSVHFSLPDEVTVYKLTVRAPLAAGWCLGAAQGHSCLSGSEGEIIFKCRKQNNSIKIIHLTLLFLLVSFFGCSRCSMLRFFSSAPLFQETVFGFQLQIQSALCSFDI